MNIDRRHNVIFVSEGKKKHPVDLNVVLKIKAADDKSAIHFLNDRVLVLHQPLSYFVQVLKNRHFIQASNQCLLNIEFISELRKGARAMAILSDYTVEPVHASKVKLIESLFTEE